MTTHAGATQNAPGQPAQVERLGRYRLLARLGQGGMGTIHLAVAGGLADFRKLLVVKELRPDLASNEHFVQMFLAEAKLAARLQHPNIVQTLEAGQDGERYFLAMEFLDGQPLSELLKRGNLEPAVPVGMRIQILCEVLAGLHYAHELCDFDDTPFQIVHRDVNPQNVFITYHGHVKLVDFGIAKVVDSELCTTAGVFKGKFPYAAPEQVDCRDVDRRVDVFAVGVMLWEILAQRRFAPGQPTMAGIDARLGGTEPRIAAVVPDVDPELAAICDRAMHVDPAQRFASAEAFRAQLTAYLAARNALATPAEISEHMRKKFEPERAAIHRLISTQVRQLVPDEEFGDSLVRVLTRAASKAGSHGSEEPITGSDAGSLRTARERPAGSRPREQPQQSPSQRLLLERKRRTARKQRYALVATALLAFLGAYLWVRVQTPAPALPAVETGRLAATSASNEAATTASAELTASPPGGAPMHGLASGSVAQPAAAAKGTPGKAPAVVPPTAAGAQSARTASPASSAAQSNALPLPQSARRAPGARPPLTKSALAEHGAASGDRRVSRGETPLHVGNTPAASGQRTLEVGDDMRVMRRARPAPARTLEDPFQ